MQGDLTTIRAIISSVAAIEFRDAEDIRFQGQYRWISLKRFDVTTDGETEELVAALIGHPRYRDHYASPESEVDAPIHGPYRLDAVHPGDFLVLPQGTGGARLQAWIDEYPVSAEAVIGRLDDLLSRLASAEQVLELQDLGKGAHHEFGFVLDLFLELVRVDGKVVELVVAAQD